MNKACAKKGTQRKRGKVKTGAVWDECYKTKHQLEKSTCPQKNKLTTITTNNNSKTGSWKAVGTVNRANQGESQENNCNGCKLLLSK